jgi:hypothetical protein
MQRRTIAVDIDDTLNNFTHALRESDFPFDPGYSVSPERFHELLPKVRSGHIEKSDLLSTEYAYFKAQIHLKVYSLSHPRPGAIAFMQGLRRDGWQIVICTYRDLRRAGAITRRWLAANDIPYDYLFRANNKVVFCRTWGIEHLIDDDPLNSTHGGLHGVKVYYPLPSPASTPHATARGFDSFEEIDAWIRK